jgi:8-oxo-dGTP pyrophosphatase MutT (NUDIX family)
MNAADIAYFNNLPKKRMAASALITDASGAILIVKPVYRPDWLTPGGTIDADESPSAACRREIAEEIGLQRSVGRLLLCEYHPGRGERTESMQFVFDCGVISTEEIARITLPPDELSEWRLAQPAEAFRLLAPPLAVRIERALTVRRSGGPLYLENGQVRG